MSAAPLTPKHPGFLVWNPAASQPRYVHSELDGAKTEARRLASQHQGQAFYVLGPVGMAYVENRPAEFHTMNPLPLQPDDDWERPF